MAVARQFAERGAFIGLYGYLVYFVNQINEKNQTNEKNADDIKTI
jgi:hypothetical protein